MGHFRPATLQFSRMFTMLRANSTFPKTHESAVLGFIGSKPLPNSHRSYVCPANPRPPERVSAMVEEICALTLLEVADLTEELRKRFGVQMTDMPYVTEERPGMAFGANAAGKVGEGAEENEKAAAEKTSFNLKLEAVDPASKLKAIKEVRALLSLGLKEAKDLVEKAPVNLKTGAAKEEAEIILEKMKAVGAKVTME